MSHTIRFPLLKAVPSVGPNESSLVITLQQGVTTFFQGGGSDASHAYGDVRAWKTIQRQTESPYSCIALEFTANGPVTIGDGTFAEQLGLFGRILNPNPLAVSPRFLIGTLGIAMGGVAPQIPIVSRTSDADIVGYSQLISLVACYDELAVGGVSGDIVLPGEIEVTVTARPIRQREYLG